MSENKTNARKAFSAALKKLCEFNSYDEISVKQIVNTAGYSRKLFYDYYSNKDDLAIKTYQADIIKELKISENNYYEYVTLDLYKLSNSEMQNVHIAFGKAIFHNKAFYRNLLNPNCQSGLIDYLSSICVASFKNYCHIKAMEQQRDFNTDNYDMICTYFTNALIGTIYSYLCNDGGEVHSFPSTDEDYYRLVSFGMTCIDLLFSKQQQ